MSEILASLKHGERMVDCPHCGEKRTGWSRIGDTEVCHTDEPGKPDCYRRITVYGEPFGVLQHQRPLPVGVDFIRNGWPWMGPFS